MTKSTIEWTMGDDGSLGETWNCIRGCTRRSPGCQFCYAEMIAARFSKPGLPFHGYAIRTAAGNAHWTGKVSLIREKLDEPLHWEKPRRVFANSMADMFHEELTNEEIAAMFGIMALCPQHTLMALTKRAERMADWFQWFEADCLRGEQRRDVLSSYAATELSDGSDEDQDRHYRDLMKRHDRQSGMDDVAWPLPNVWLGVSVESADYKHRIDTLRTVPARLRFLSLEPLLGDLGALDLRGIGWVIDGGLSKSGESPAHPQWFRNNRDQCEAAGVPYFHKQAGEYADASDNEELRANSNHARIILPSGEVIGGGTGNRGMVPEDWRERGGAWMARVGKKAAGALLDGKLYRAFPETT